MTLDPTDATQLLGPLERRAMAQLWAAGPQSVGEMLDALNNTGGARPLAYSTVMTILVRLHEKGFVTRQKEGRHYRYTAAVEASAVEEHAGRRELSRLIERYGAGSVARFAANLGEGGLAGRLARLARESERQE